MIPYGRQFVDDDDVKAVVEVLNSDWLTCGPKVGEFEEALSAYCGARHAVAVSSGTAALHVACLAAGLCPGDRVVTSSITFLASANCAEFVGARADFADIDSETLNMAPDSLRKMWTPDIKAVIPVDFAGQPCDIVAISEIARDRKAVVIEDACHALGSSFRIGERIFKTGGHEWADMTVFSFHPVKTITTGEGGAILTNNDDLAKRCRMFRNHGIVKDPHSWVAPLEDDAAWYYEMQELGFNYRLTDIQCALGLSQLSRIDEYVKRRRAIAETYNRRFSALPSVRIPGVKEGFLSSWHLYVLLVEFSSLDTGRGRVMRQLAELGVGTQVHYIPVYLQPYYRRKYGYRSGKCPAAETYYERCLSLPLFPAMSDTEVERVISAVTEVVSG